GCPLNEGNLKEVGNLEKMHTESTTYLPGKNHISSHVLEREHPTMPVEKTKNVLTNDGFHES
ncbi:hypothetical protein HMPREF1281_01287, partial [Corynebacterium sp. KPL1855]|uniref:hypothetical protein n=1 Tax=Corynebacterium sp. KPL1855 TaxID=1203562 RepID=UPI0003B84F3D